MFDSDDEETNIPINNVNSNNSNNSNNELLQTQPESNKLVSDIFGDEDDDDDDNNNNNTNVINNKPIYVSNINNLNTNLYDSDEEDNNINNNINNNKLINKKHKLSSSHHHQKHKKLNNHKSHKISSSSSLQNSDSEDDTEGKANVNDYLFIDSDEEENADIMKEYKSDNRNFDDENNLKSSKKKKSDNNNNNNKERSQSKSNDPLSQTLEAMKLAKKTNTELNEEQKNLISTNLLMSMDKAYKEDEYLREQNKPAINKLMLLNHVQNVCNLKVLQDTLLEYDLLSSLKLWINPIDNGKNLPALSLRLPIYELLLNLPCQIDHLKKSSIGKTIVSLRQHKLETIENKRLLKKIMEKWCRPIFNKSADTRSTYGKQVSVEQHEIARQRQLELLNEFNKKNHIQNANNNNNNNNTNNTNNSNNSYDSYDNADIDHESQSINDNNDNNNTSNLLDINNNNNNNEVVDQYNRARRPFSNGFYFTVRPENKINTKQISRHEIEDDLEIDTETGKVISRHKPGSSKHVVPDTYQNKLNKQITELKKARGTMGLGVKKPFKIQVK